jgi:hypothetical protein
MSKATLYRLEQGHTEKEPILTYNYPKLNRDANAIAAQQEMLANEDITNADLIGALDRGLPLWFNYLAKQDPVAKAAALKAAEARVMCKAVKAVWTKMHDTALAAGKTEEQIAAILGPRPE